MLKRTLVLLLSLLIISAVATADGELRPLPLDLTGGAPYDTEYASDLLVYEDPSIRVERTLRTQNKELRLEYYTVDIRIKDPPQIRTAPADPTTFVSERRIPADTIARRVNAIFAMNGDYCGDFHGHESSKYILRQGTLYRDTVDTRLDMLIIDEAGDFHIVQGGPELENMDKTAVDGKKAVNVLQFGPALVIDGQEVDDAYIMDKNHSPQFAEPAGNATRLCLVQFEPLHYMAICTRNYANMAQFKQLVKAVAPDCTNAYVLDGGGSAQFIFLGRKINNVNAETNQNKRKLSDIVYFASAWFEEGE